MRFGDERVLALLSGLVGFRLLPRGFVHHDLRQRVGALLGRDLRPGQMTYDLRRLRLHGLMTRQPGSPPLPGHPSWLSGGIV
jgi:hypothetical protein